jgi:hypothetical protein
VCVVLVVALATAAFAANYPWAHAPLLISIGSFACIGIAASLAERRLPWGVAGSLIILILAVGIQLIPFPSALRVMLSPHRDQLAGQLDLSFAVLASGSQPLTIDVHRTRLGLLFLITLAGLVLATAGVLGRASARKAAGGIAIVGTILALFGIAQKAMWNGKIYGFWQPFALADSFGPFVNRNHYAGWMLMAIPLTVGLLLATIARTRVRETAMPSRVRWLTTPEASQAILLGFSLLAMTLAMVQTMSRSGILVLTAVSTIGAVLVIIRSSTEVARSRVAFALVGVIFLTAILWAGVTDISNRFGEQTTLTGGSRLEIWATTLTIARDFWLTGTGLNTFGASTLFYPAPLEGRHLREAHSEYLQLFAEGGLLLVFPAVAALAVFAVEARKRLLADRGSAKLLRAGALLSVLAILVQSVAEFSLQMPANATLFAFVAGIALHDSSR